MSAKILGGVVGVCLLVVLGAAYAAHVWMGEHRLVPIVASQLGYGVGMDTTRSTGPWSYGGGAVAITDASGVTILTLSRCEESLRFGMMPPRLVRTLRMATAGGSEADLMVEAPLLTPLAPSRVAGSLRLDLGFAQPSGSTSAILQALLLGGGRATSSLTFELTELESLDRVRGFVEGTGRLEAAQKSLLAAFRAAIDLRIEIAGGKAKVVRAGLDADGIKATAQGLLTLVEPVMSSPLDVRLEAKIAPLLAMVLPRSGEWGLNADGKLPLVVAGTLARPRLLSLREWELTRSPTYRFISREHRDCYTADFATASEAAAQAAAVDAVLVVLDCEAAEDGPGLIAFELYEAPIGVLVGRVAPNDLFGRIGLQADDILKTVGGEAVDAGSRFQIVRDIASANREVLIELERDGQPLRLLVARVMRRAP